MKVLFITSTRIGDAVLSTSILNYLKNRFPHCSLYIATGKTAASLFKNFGNIKKIFILKKKKFKIYLLKICCLIPMKPLFLLLDKILCEFFLKLISKEFF
mgnify:CR=1 FL=1